MSTQLRVIDDRIPMRTQPRSSLSVIQTEKKKKKKKKSKPGRDSSRVAGFSGGPSLSATGATSIGAAVRNSGLRNVGLQNILDHTVAWVCGYIYVGNGTLGATDQILFQPQSSTTQVVGGIVPIAAADINVGASFLADIEKHYARKRVHSIKMSFHSLQPSTTNSMEAVVAPVRGAFGVVNSALSTIDQTMQAYQSVLSMAEAVSCASWQDIVMDLTKFIAGGYGAKQNEFLINNPIANGSDKDIIGQDAELTVPCAFAVSGQNSTTALRGTRTHAVVITQRMDLLDFVGGETAFNPVGRPDIFAHFAARRQFNQRLRSLGSLLLDEKSDTKDVKSDSKAVVGPTQSHCEAAGVKMTTPMVSIPSDTGIIPVHYSSTTPSAVPTVSESSGIIGDYVKLRTKRLA